MEFDLVSRNSSGDNMLLEACETGNLETIELLLNHGSAKIDCRNRRVETPLFLALQSKRWGIVDVLLKFGSMESTSGRRKLFQILRCIAFDDLEDIEYLARGIADIDFRHLREVTPLRFAVIQRNQKFVEFLLDCGADVNIIEWRGMQPLLSEVIYCPEDDEVAARIFDISLQRGANVNRHFNVGGYTQFSFSTQLDIEKELVNSILTKTFQDRLSQMF